MIQPGSWLGMLGGGQLGRMFTHAAQALGYKVLVLDPDPLSPAGAVADRHLAAAYLDEAALDELARRCAAVTTEFENVPATALDRLARTIPTRPAASAVRIAQDRVAEKSFVVQQGFDVAPYKPLFSESECRGLPAELFPGIVKTARLGYDGKGQVAVASEGAALDAFRALKGQPCVLERKIALEREISVLVSRGADGATAVWPIAENQHRDGILDVSIVPARIGRELELKAQAMGTTIADRLGYVGVLCVEMFVARDGSLLVNEMAPRPHNSGHWTIDGAVTSQFEQQCRALVGAPLGATHAHSAAVMINLLGDIWFESAAGDALREPDWAAVLREPSAKLHLYGKREPRRARKMGHVTLLGETLEARLAAAARVKRAFGIPEN
jgi:5-(carboxyamino)imidazole ribonucleotide synthase